MDDERVEQISRALKEKGVNQPCPRCTNQSFSIAGESKILIQEDPSAFQIGGKSIPTILVACSKCGYITQHAQIPLGLLKGGK
jgi:hypothetical protein